MHKIILTILSFIDDYNCFVCRYHLPDRAFIPCGHVICNHCIQRLQRHECPFCREPFDAILQIYLPLLN